MYVWGGDQAVITPVLLRKMVSHLDRAQDLLNHDLTVGERIQCTHETSCWGSALCARCRVTVLEPLVSNLPKDCAQTERIHYLDAISGGAAMEVFDY